MKEMEVLKEAVQKAGEAVLSLSKNGYTTSYKKEDDPITSADLTANQILQDILLKEFPQYGWLSEESSDNLARLEQKYLWIVDPIDGTKEFIQSIPEYVISAALVEDHTPQLGVIYNPVTQELFAAIKGKGMWYNQKPVLPSSLQTTNILLVSRTEHSQGNFAFFQDKMKIQPMGSIAYKLALLACGKGDAILSFRPKNEWDIAAATLFLLEMGGEITDLNRTPIHFNQKSPHIHGIIATMPTLDSKNRQWIEECLTQQGYH